MAVLGRLRTGPIHVRIGAMHIDHQILVCAGRQRAVDRVEIALRAVGQGRLAVGNIKCAPFVELLQKESWAPLGLGTGRQCHQCRKVEPVGGELLFKRLQVTDIARGNEISTGTG